MSNKITLDLTKIKLKVESVKGAAPKDDSHTNTKRKTDISDKNTTGILTSMATPTSTLEGKCPSVFIPSLPGILYEKDLANNFCNCWYHRYLARLG